MTISPERRKELMREALRLMLLDLGNSHAFDEVAHQVVEQDAAVAPFQDIPWTTWEDLEARGYVEAEHVMGAQRFVLTGAGWIAALKVSKQYDTPQHQAQVNTLRRALVDLNKGRPAEGTLTDINEIVSRTSLLRAITWNCV